MVGRDRKRRTQPDDPGQCSVADQPLGVGGRPPFAIWPGLPAYLWAPLASSKRDGIEAVEIRCGHEDGWPGSIRCSRTREIFVVYGQVLAPDGTPIVLEAQLLEAQADRHKAKQRLATARRHRGAATQATDKAGLKPSWHNGLRSAKRSRQHLRGQEQLFLKGAGGRRRIVDGMGGGGRAPSSSSADAGLSPRTEATVAASRAAITTGRLTGD